MCTIRLAVDFWSGFTPMRWQLSYGEMDLIVRSRVR